MADPPRAARCNRHHNPAPPQAEVSALDLQHMARALELAERGRGTTHPNPMVGCVLAHGADVVGEGWHLRPGAPHAERVALDAALDRARGATAYVTLEPCNHTGRTPPCSDALMAAGVARVVIALRDPDARVSGSGIARLQAAGIEVLEGVHAAEAAAQSAAYLTHRREGRPWVRYKTAMTLDGKIATRTGRSRWITGELARARVQLWRHQADAIAIGVNTLLQDDPALTTRLTGEGAPGRTPRKIVFDGVARTPVTARIFQAAPDGAPAQVTLVVGPEAPAARTEVLAARGAQILRVEARASRPDVRQALQLLAAEGVVELLLEGGGTLAWAFVEAGAIDRVAFFVAPKLVGGRGATPLAGLGVATLDEAIALQSPSVEPLGDDLLIEGNVKVEAQ